jgi:hypothetical protein
MDLEKSPGPFYLSNCFTKIEKELNNAMVSNYYHKGNFSIDLDCSSFHREFSSFNKTRSLATANLTADLTVKFLVKFHNFFQKTKGAKKWKK